MRKAEDLYRRYGPSVLARCRRVLGDSVAAEDAMQEVFVRALRKPEAVPEDDREALAWLYRVGTNVCLDVLRGRQVRAAADLAPASPPAASADGAQAVESRQACLRALSQVPAPLAAAAALYYLDEVEQGQIAAILGVSRRTVLNRLAQFLALARKALGGAKA